MRNRVTCSLRHRFVDDAEIRVDATFSDCRAADDERRAGCADARASLAVYGLVWPQMQPGNCFLVKPFDCQHCASFADCLADGGSLIIGVGQWPRLSLQCNEAAVKKRSSSQLLYLSFSRHRPRYVNGIMLFSFAQRGIFIGGR